MKTILFVNHKKSQCGVYEFGENVFEALKLSHKYSFVKAECGSLKELHDAVTKSNPAAIIYNYMPTTMPWLVTSYLNNRIIRNNIMDIPVKQIGIIHSIMQDIADTATQGKQYAISFNPEIINRVFDFYIAPDPTLILKNPFVFKHGRPVKKYEGIKSPEKLRIGTFGFAKNGYIELIRKVQDEFDDAEIRINIPFATFGDKEGTEARRIENECKKAIHKPGIALSISHDYLEKEKLLRFLSENTINVFIRDNAGRGISSVIDYALAVDRPIAICTCPMFRHISIPKINIETNSLKSIIANGTKPLLKFKKEWTLENLCWEYENMLDIILAPSYFPKKPRWISKDSCDDSMDKIKYPYYHCIEKDCSYNRILNNESRELYRRTISYLFKILPNTMKEKIPEANVQQAFVFDTIVRKLKNYHDPKILCVGSYKDTACMGLKKMGIELQEIDPIYNYSLEQFVTKPDIAKHSYDIIFSTSVIEHVMDDNAFMKCVSDLLSPNGILIMTCDFKEGWKQGDKKPGVCERFYTKDKLTGLMENMKGCTFLDEPNWNGEPDFKFGSFNYSFASFVIRKEII